MSSAFINTFSKPIDLKTIHWIDFLTAYSLKIVPRPALVKSVVVSVMAYHGYRERKACAMTHQQRSIQRKPMVRDPRSGVRQRMNEIVQTRIRYGYRRVYIMLRREGLDYGIVRNRATISSGLCIVWPILSSSIGTKANIRDNHFSGSRPLPRIVDRTLV